MGVPICRDNEIHEVRVHFWSVSMKLTPSRPLAACTLARRIPSSHPMPPALGWGGLNSDVFTQFYTWPWCILGETCAILRQFVFGLKMLHTRTNIWGLNISHQYVQYLVYWNTAYSILYIHGICFLSRFIIVHYDIFVRVLANAFWPFEHPNFSTQLSGSDWGSTPVNARDQAWVWKLRTSLQRPQRNW